MNIMIKGIGSDGRFDEAGVRRLLDTIMNYCCYPLADTMR